MTQARPIPTPQAGPTNPRLLSIERSGRSSAQRLSARKLASLPIVAEAAWHPDGSGLFFAATYSGRLNIWSCRLEGGGAPKALTHDKDAQRGLAPLPDGRLLFLQDRGGDEYHDIVCLDVRSGEVTRLTSNPDMAFDRLRVSPDGRLVAFACKRRTSSQRNLGFLDLRSLELTMLTDEADPEGFWSPVGWTSDSHTLIANREQNLLGGSARPFRVDVRSGVSEALVDARDRGRDIASGVVEDDELTVLVTSNFEADRTRAGIYSPRSRAYRWFDPSPWPQATLALSPDRRRALYQVWTDCRTELKIVDLKTFEEITLDLLPGTNEPCCLPRFSFDGQPFSPHSSRLLVSHSGGAAPQSLYLGDCRTGALDKILSGPKLEGDLPRVEIVTFASHDNTLVSGILTLPHRSEPHHLYPAIIVPHGGPTAASNDDFDIRAALFASHGYVVLRPNYRGSTGYGTLFQQAQRGDMGGADLDDLVAARAFLISTGCVDPDRIGITGTSAGGWLTLLAIGRYPEMFQAAVQVAGVADWKTFFDRADPLLRSYVSSLFGSQDLDSETYRKASPIAYADRIRTPLLSIVGANDMRVPASQAWEIADALDRNGVPNATLVFEDEGHFFLKSENVAEELERTLDWFERFLVRRTST